MTKSLVADPITWKVGVTWMKSKGKEITTKTSSTINWHNSYKSSENVFSIENICINLKLKFSLNQD